jgi:2'-5' RNA ligase
MAKTRTFIGVPALDEVEVAALTAIDRLRSATEGVKWVEPENLHWTLQFLGDLTDQEMADVCLRTARAAARCEVFSLQARGVGAFPSIHRPRTLWLGAGEGRDQFAALHSAIDDALEPLGFRRESRPFTPHLTLGRIAGAAGPVLTERLAQLADLNAGSMSVDEAIVYASELTREGPVYTVLARAPLS